MRTLIDLYTKHGGKVTNKWSLYLSEYEKLFSCHRTKAVCVLEIGIQNGGSLEIWANYFTNSKVIVGCDITNECANLTFNDPRIFVVIGDVNNESTIARILDISPSYDVIIDDGSHLSRDVIKSFSEYFRHLTYGGTYVVEDMHCSYWDSYEGGLFYPYSSMYFFKRLADVVNYEHWGVTKKRENILQGFSDHFEIDFRESDLAEIHSIEFINSVCVIRKERLKNNLLGERLVVGSFEPIASGHFELSGMPSLAPPQTENPWSTRFSAPEEDWERILNDLEKRSTQLDALRLTLGERDSQINSLQYTLAECNNQIHTLQLNLAERDNQFDAIQHTISELDKQIISIQHSLSERNSKVQELQNQIQMYAESKSWKLTRPFRKLGRQLRILLRSLPRVRLL